MKGRAKFVIFLILLAALFAGGVYFAINAANILTNLLNGKGESDSFWTVTRAIIAVSVYGAIALLAAIGIVSCILRHKFVFVIFIIYFAAILGASGYFGFLHLKSMPYNVNTQTVITLIVYIGLIIVSIAGIIICALAMRNRRKTDPYAR